MCDKQFIKTISIKLPVIIHKQVGGESFTQLQFQHHGQSSERGRLRLNTEDTSDVLSTVLVRLLLKCNRIQITSYPART